MASIVVEMPTDTAPVQGQSPDEGAIHPQLQKPVRRYSCSVCQKAFKRSEHCSRHERGHTREKPFTCRHCGRRYARKDLVTRHEQSFHPFEISRRQQSPVTETTLLASTQMSNVEPTEETTDPAPQAQSTLDPILQRYDEQIAESQRRASWTAKDKTNDPKSNEQASTSSHHAEAHREYDSAELPMAIDGPLPTPVLSSGPGISQPFGDSSMPGMNDEFLVNLLNNATGQSGQTPNSDTVLTQTSEASQSGPSGQVWDPSRTNWQDPDTFSRHEFAADPNTISNEPPAMAHQIENYFQDVDIFSMLPNGGTNIEADFAIPSYLFNSGYSPPIDNESPQLLWDANERNLSVAMHGTSLIAIRAVAEPFDPVPFAGSSARLPTVVNETPRQISLRPVDSDIHSLILKDIEKRLSHEQLKDFNMPSAQSLQRFLVSYLTCFHRHYPILHFPSLDLRNAPTPLILAMCAIGALYRLSRKTAKDLWFWANKMLELELQTPPSDLMSPSTIAAAQCKLLLSLFAVFSGDVTEQALTQWGYWTTEYRLRRAILALKRPNTESLSWESWCLRETSKRLLYGIFIMSSLMTVAYDMTPSFSVTQDIDLEMPDEERLWEATNAQQWEEIIKSRKAPTLISVRDAMTHLIFAKEDSTSRTDVMSWTAFATTVIMHAVNVHMWNIMQFTQSFTTFAIGEQNNTDLRACLVTQVESALARCYTLLTADRSEREHTSDDLEGPLIFNCLALLRSAYVRVATGAGNFNRMMLLWNDPDQVTSSIQSYIDSPQERNPFLTTAVHKAYGGLLIPIKAGHLLVRKTAALSWSVEHAIAAWDCALFVLKWIHTMEMQQRELPPNDEEMRNLTNFAQLLTEVDSEYNGKGSLAAEVTRVWASFLDDTWVWGITPRMGYVLRLMSAAFAEEWRLKFINGNEDGPISR
ncbi:hypothetical protein V499_01484 [Pseudogymnoascus sp. VKM F-103]|nr:hypothetical protein V499_01484 [Pseudogymnoascus sp. VKM F-103]